MPAPSLQIQPLFQDAEQKNKLLRSVAGGGMEELTQLRARWDKFEIMMESHQMMIKDQVSLSPLSLFLCSTLSSRSLVQMQVMCSRVEGEIHTFMQELGKFSSRWEQLKPKPDLLDGDKQDYASALASLKERRSEFDELMKTARKLR